MKDFPTDVLTEQVLNDWQEVLAKATPTPESRLGAVEVVPGHQSARFASEQREKRGLK